MVDRSGGLDACHRWTSRLDDKGYGAVRFGGRSRRAHSVAFELEHGPIPEGKEVCHSCDNPPCCNGRHLFAWTHQENMDDMVAKGRQARGDVLAAPKRGSGNPQASLTETQVIEIRERSAHGCRIIDLAAEYGISQPRISDILTGKAWAHVGGPTRPPMSHAEAQRLGSKTKGNRTLQTKLPVVLREIRRLISSGVRPSMRICWDIDGYHAVRNHFKHSQIVSMASEAQ